MRLRSFSRKAAVEQGICEQDSDRDIIHLTRQSSNDPTQTIETIGKISGAGDTKLKIINWLPISIILIYLVAFKDPFDPSNHISITLKLTSVVIGSIFVQLVVVILYPVSSATKLRKFETLYCRIDGFADITVP